MRPCPPHGGQTPWGRQGPHLFLCRRTFRSLDRTVVLGAYSGEGARTKLFSGCSLARCEGVFACRSWRGVWDCHAGRGGQRCCHRLAVPRTAPRDPRPEVPGLRHLRSGRAGACMISRLVSPALALSRSREASRGTRGLSEVQPEDVSCWVGAEPRGFGVGVCTMSPWWVEARERERGGHACETTSDHCLESSLSGDVWSTRAPAPPLVRWVVLKPFGG